jgi:hypothetical protein
MANQGFLGNVTKWAENQNQRAVEDFERRFLFFFIFF